MVSPENQPQPVTLESGDQISVDGEIVTYIGTTAASSGEATIVLQRDLDQELYTRIKAEELEEKAIFVSHRPLVGRIATIVATMTNLKVPDMTSQGYDLLAADGRERFSPTNGELDSLTITSSDLTHLPEGTIIAFVDTSLSSHAPLSKTDDEIVTKLLSAIQHREQGWSDDQELQTIIDRYYLGSRGRIWNYARIFNHDGVFGFSEIAIENYPPMWKEQKEHTLDGIRDYFTSGSSTTPMKFYYFRQVTPREMKFLHLRERSE